MVKMNVNIFHFPVFYHQIITLMDIQPDHVVLDGTCGEGGHAELILKLLSSEGHYIGLDKDNAILSIAQKRLLPYHKSFNLIHSSYAESKTALKTLSIQKVDRILLDLGLSMYHIRSEGRGFSYQSDALLDMRFDQSSPAMTAFEIIHTLPEEELSEILREYGEESYANKIARSIVITRKTSLIKTCQDLSQLILRVKPFTGHIHPATKTFQALRIAVNQELTDLKKFLPDVPYLLNKGGRIGVISYHSLEDRIIKRFFQDQASLEILNKKVITPTLEEINLNPASRSAKLRMAVLL